MNRKIWLSLKPLLFIAAIVGLTPAAASANPQAEASCIETSARYNALPPMLLLAVRQQEAGRVGGWRNNLDGSMDYGVMQINSRWLPLLAEAGYTAEVLVYNACASIAAGAWILAQALARYDSWNRSGTDAHTYWRAIGDYHSHTPARNRAYAKQVWTRYQVLVARRA